MNSLNRNKINNQTHQGYSYPMQQVEYIIIEGSSKILDCRRRESTLESHNLTYY